MSGPQLRDQLNRIDSAYQDLLTTANATSRRLDRAEQALRLIYLNAEDNAAACPNCAKVAECAKDGLDSE